MDDWILEREAIDRLNELPEVVFAEARYSTDREAVERGISLIDLDGIQDEMFSMSAEQIRYTVLASFSDINNKANRARGSRGVEVLSGIPIIRPYLFHSQKINDDILLISRIYNYFYKRGIFCYSWWDIRKFGRLPKGSWPGL